jgi:hypothetical protein
VASLVWKDAFVSIAGTDVSDNIKSVKLDYSADEVEDTNMGDDSHLFIGGLKNWSLELECTQDFAVGVLDSILFPLVGTACALIVRPIAATAVGTSNPNYTGSGLLSSYSPIGGAVGEKAMAPVKFVAAGNLSRATA